tara:strand:- start:1943 stop:2359 length:417 start_codon:yes stop_codon:yes gene_type:complete
MKVIQKLDIKTIGYISTFEKITKNHPIAFLEKNGQLIFIVKEGTARKTIGPRGSNIKRLSNMLAKSIKVIEYSKDPQKFLLNIVFPIKPEIIEQHEDTLLIRPSTHEDKARLIGRNSNNINFTKALLKKHHNLDVRVA